MHAYRYSETDITIDTMEIRGDARLTKGGEDGEGYTQRLATAGRPVLQERLDAFNSKVDALNQDFTKRHGWVRKASFRKPPVCDQEAKFQGGLVQPAATMSARAED
jgi:hypothetical protein